MLDFFRRGPLKWWIVTILVPIVDLALSPLTFAAAFYLKLIRRAGVARMRVSKAVFERVGVFPIRDHYYEPMFNMKRLRHSLRQDRNLPGIDLNVAGQLELLERFRFAEELKKFSHEKRHELEYYYNNTNFGPGDSEYLYTMIRLHRPSTVLEIGSGFSTLMASNAISANRLDDPAYQCRHICIEPYEMPWLNNLPHVEILRTLVENVDRTVFSGLKANDILFIDSSHVIRPQGDVVVEYLEILPILQLGVIVHIHDIFTPKDYPDVWILEHIRLWNEQYLVEAFLSFNNRFKVIGMLNFLKHHYPEKLMEKCPIQAEVMATHEPASLWLVRN